MYYLHHTCLFYSLYLSIFKISFNKLMSIAPNSKDYYFTKAYQQEYGKENNINKPSDSNASLSDHNHIFHKYEYSDLSSDLESSDDDITAIRSELIKKKEIKEKNEIYQDIDSDSSIEKDEKNSKQKNFSKMVDIASNVKHEKAKNIKGRQIKDKEGHIQDNIFNNKKPSYYNKKVDNKFYECDNELRPNLLHLGINPIKLSEGAYFIIGYCGINKISKKKKMLIIESRIKSLCSDYDVSSIFLVMKKIGFVKLSSEKYWNYLLQVFFSKLSISQLYIIWKELISLIYDVCFHEYSNRVIQSLFKILINCKETAKEVTDVAIKITPSISYQKYGAFVVQNFLSLNFTQKTDFIESFIEENFLSLVFHVNGVILTKKYVEYLANEKKMKLEELYHCSIKPTMVSLVNHKYSHYLILKLIDLISYLIIDDLEKIYLDQWTLLESEYSKEIIKHIVKKVSY